MGKYKDYTKTREVIESARIYYASTIKDAPSSDTALFIKIPNKVRNNLGLMASREKQFRVIIVRKEALK